MPPASAPKGQTSQERPSLDVKRLGRVVGKFGSKFETEWISAVEIGTRMLATAGLRWEDLVTAYDDAGRTQRAEAAAEHLLEVNNALRAENEQLRAEASQSTAVALWADVGTKPSEARIAAAWALDLHRRGLIQLTPRELDFLERTVPTWVGALRPKQKDWLQGILDRAVARTGLVPPSS